MRIALVTPGFSADATDWCIPALWDLVRGLAREHEVLVVALRYPAPARTYRVHGARVVALGAGQVRGWRRALFLARARGRLAWEVAAFGAEVVHALWAHEPGALSVGVAARGRRPCLVSLLGGELVGLDDIDYGGQITASNRTLVSRALARADLVSSGSRALDALAADLVPTQRRRILPFGVDRERFSTHGDVARLAGRPALLRVASLSPVKDPLTLLRAVAGLDRCPDAHLHLVGAGELGPAIRRRAEELGITARLTLHGELPHDRLAPLYRGADLCVSSSRFESQGLVLLEALACGTATAGTAVGLLPELVDAELLCPPRDASALAATIGRALEPGSGPRPLPGRFDLEATLAAWVEAYRELAPAASAG